MAYAMLCGMSIIPKVIPEVKSPPIYSFLYEGIQEKKGKIRFSIYYKSNTSHSFGNKAVASFSSLLQCPKKT
jgi:hypothetical protein